MFYWFGKLDSKVARCLYVILLPCGAIYKPVGYLSRDQHKKFLKIFSYLKGRFVTLFRGATAPQEQGSEATALSI